jgi:3,4-dihydroxy 2-butanone 4-phosphate synthase/GTP cyclohydrolase II
MRTAFTVSTDYRHGTTTGISAADRALTLRALVDESAAAGDFSRPGHIFPLRAVAGGVLRRPGHTEAAVDLSRLAGLRPGGVLCELVNDDGTMARLPELESFAKRHGLPLISIADLIAYRKRTERIVHRRSEARMPTRFGQFTAYSYESEPDGLEHIALAMGDVAGRADILVRVHSECLTGDLFGSMRCDCGAQLESALAKVAREGAGVIVYLRGHEGRGIGLSHKLKAYALQDAGRDTVQANTDLGLSVDARDYAVGAQILADLGVTSMRLMTNNPAKYNGIADFGLSISARVPLVTQPNKENVAYLRTKQAKLGHLLEMQEAAA